VGTGLPDVMSVTTYMAYIYIYTYIIHSHHKQTYVDKYETQFTNIDIHCTYANIYDIYLRLRHMYYVHVCCVYVSYMTVAYGQVI